MAHRQLLLCVRASVLLGVAGARERTHLRYGGFVYRTIMDAVPVDGFQVDSGEGFEALCHISWLPLPAGGYELAPDTPELREVLTAHTWSTHVVVLGSRRGYRTPKNPPRGVVFGDWQDKVVTRVRNGVAEYLCPWACYQVLVRRPLGQHRVGSTADKIEEAVEGFVSEHPDVLQNLSRLAYKDLRSLMRPVHENDSPLRGSAPAEGEDAPVLAWPRGPWVIAGVAVVLAAICVGVAIGALCHACLHRGTARKPTLRGSFAEADEELLEARAYQEMRAAAVGPPQ